MRGVTSAQAQRYARFFLQSRSDVIQLELLEISHPSFSRVYRVVRNATQGVQVTLETGEVSPFVYYPLKITPSAMRDDLDFEMDVELGDLGELLPSELDAVLGAGTTATKPTVLYRTYRSDDLTRPLFGPVKLEIAGVTTVQDGGQFTAQAPAANAKGTGEVYTFNRFPMLRWIQ